MDFNKRSQTSDRLNKFKQKMKDIRQVRYFQKKKRTDIRQVRYFQKKEDRHKTG